MERERRSGSPTYDQTAALVRKLDALKREGSNLLVVGQPRFAHASTCTRFLGDVDSGPRRRLFVVSDAGARVEGRVPEAVCRPDPDRLRVLTCAGTSRSATVGHAEIGEPAETRTDRTRLDALGCAVSAAIDDFESASGGLEPAELRLCFDSLASLLDARTPEWVFRFLHLLTRRVCSARGMGHYHLPLDRDDATVRLLAPLFDAVVELSVDGEAIYQRWQFRDDDMTTGWLRV